MKFNSSCVYLFIIRNEIPKYRSRVNVFRDHNLWTLSYYLSGANPFGWTESRAQTFPHRPTFSIDRRGLAPNFQGLESSPSKVVIARMDT